MNKMINWQHMLMLCSMQEQRHCGPVVVELWHHTTLPYSTAKLPVLQPRPTGALAVWPVFFFVLGHLIFTFLLNYFPGIKVDILES